MDKTWVLCSSVFLIYVTQIQHVFAADCNITSITSPSGSTMNVTWMNYTQASVYLLDLRDGNATNVAPVVAMQSAPNTQALVQGLKPGHIYTVTLNVFHFYTIVCSYVQTALTVPDVTQITLVKAISSTSVRVDWASVLGAITYILFVEESTSPPRKGLIVNQTLTNTSTQVGGLAPATLYSCYVYTANSAGLGAKSSVKAIVTLVQPPVNVTLVSTGKSTARVTWSAVSKVLLYQVTVSAPYNPNIPTTIKNSTLTSMDITGLAPCTNYTVGVTSLNTFLVPGNPTTATINTPGINAVTNVTARYSCSTGTATVSWKSVLAPLYRASVVDGTGASMNCTSTSTTCDITNLNCGEYYNVYVTAISSPCEVISSVYDSFFTVPCAPTNTQTQYECSSNAVQFSWQPTNNTYYYVATAVDNNGDVTECVTLDDTCYFTNVDCGQSYQYTVYAVSKECNSLVSQPLSVWTAPCLPTDIITITDCSSNILTTTWEPAAGALLYNVEALGSSGKNYYCNSSSTSCVLSGVSCGESLSVWLVASNQNCSTVQVLGDVAQSAPCSPINVSVNTECIQDSAAVNWIIGDGAIFFIAVAEGPNGNPYTCNAMSTSCFIRGLSCGQNYTASVISTNLLCNSTSTQVNFITAPCPPTGVQAIRNCDTNQALIAWNNEQLPGLYTVTLEDESKAKLNCTSNTVNNCSITSPPCGKRFNVTVTYNDGRCLSYSTPVSMDSVPCGPVDVKANVSCATGELTVTWISSVTTSNYTSIISRQPDQPLRCNSVNTQCTTSGLLCGSSYAVTVFSITGTCLSLPSSVVTVQSLPCPPTSVTATHACAPDPVPVSWVASDSAKYYTAVAVTSGGYTSQCQTNTTSCALSELHCGDVYSITVAGVDDTCTGQPSNNLTLVTEPCTPANVSSKLFCSSGIAKVSWAPSVNALSYAVKATSSDQILNCTTSSTNCTLSDLLCGHTYDIQVSATDGTCVSNYSSLFRHDKVPCAPQNVSTNLACGSDILTVSWNSSPEPLNYSVTAVVLGGNVSSASCHTSAASCDLGGLQCGQTYNVSVQASSGGCFGPCSSAQTVSTAPCPPLGLTAVVDCGANSLLASWNASLGATSYTTTVTGPNGFSKSCSSSDLTCSVSGLQCASQYNVTVASMHATCTSSLSQTHVTTGPCDPVNVTGVLICGSDAATVSWEASAGAVAYIALAQDSSSQLYASCGSNTTSCRLNHLQCGKAYNLTVLAEDATCNSTGSNRAVLTTAPCALSVLSSYLICGKNSSSVSWQPVANAINYTVTATTTTWQPISCSSTTTACNLADLMCSETYTATVVAQGSQCDSAPSSSINITTVPCSPSFITTQYSCGTNTAAFSWTGPVGSLSYLAQVDAGGYNNSCQTTNTSCVFQNLPCGLNFKASVQVQGLQCNSLPSVSDTLETVPCAPNNVSASLVCSNNSALVTWVGTPTAVGYNVTATTQNGHTSYCYTTTTSCQVSIQCGKTYNITVTPHSQTCTGNPSSVYSFSAGLCAPCNVSKSSSCEANTVSWSNVTGAQMYRATATAGDGSTQTCSSNTSNSCDFANLLCGQTYGITVATLDRGCWSTPSPAVNLTTAPCVPTNLSGQFCCENKVLTVTWGQSSVTGATYMLQTETIGGATPTVYTTVNTTYALNALCGQTYTFQVAAQDGSCNSSYSPPIEITTEPCQPVIVSAEPLCQNDSVYVSWNRTSNAVNYITTVTGNLGYVNTYNTSQTFLSATLPCGQDYNATLRAQGTKCYSLPSSAAFITTTPCVPRNLTTQVQCKFNTSSVSWEPSNGAKTYTVVATGLYGHTHDCVTNTTSCSWNDLHCGEQYSVVVMANSSSCSSLASNTAVIYMMPCVPMNVSVMMNCASNTAVVSWSHSRRAVQYLVTATSYYDNVTCQASGLNCTLYNLTCGSGYAAKVVAVGDNCSSVPSEAVTFNSSPCPPQNVSAHVSCLSNDMMVSWSAVREADQFLVSALPSNGGLSKSCSTTNTSCSISSLTCGATFTVQVTSVIGNCSSQSQAQDVLSAPCQPQAVRGSFDCFTKSPFISWDAAAGADSYTVTAAGEAGNTANCTTASNTTCEVKGLACGLCYNFSVTAANLQCESPPSGSIQLKTEPCVATNLSVSYNNSVAQVMWNKAKGASSSSVQAQTPQGPTVTCNSTSTWCSLSGLQCSRIYNITVTSQNLSCNDTVVSDPYVLITEPCPPTNVQANMVCDQLTSTVSWVQSGLAVGYVAYFNDWNGHYTSCLGSSTDSSCSVSGLTCGTVYDVWVKAVGQQYNSSNSAMVLLTSAPCQPTDIKVDVNCESDGAAVVSWNTTYGTANFTLSAAVNGSRQTLCTTQQNSCNVTGLSCGQTYNVSVAASNVQCIAAAVNASLTTRPCPPQHVAADLLCDTLAVVVSWDQASGVDLYVASATSASGGRVQTCNSTGARCPFTSLSCGDTYNFTVVARSQGCWSQASNPVSIQTEPCQPVIVSAEALCQNDSVYVSWNQTSNAVNYITTVTGNLGYVNTYNTSQTFLSATLPCGQDYNATLRAQGTKCYSLPSSAAFITTTPCVPRNLTTKVQCKINASSVSWEPSNGAKTYTVVATGLDGHTHDCVTNTTSCSWNDLHCGEQYSVVVMANSSSCSSLASNTAVIYMSPCVPQSLASSVNCSGKVVSLSWDASNGSTFYTVSADAANHSATLSTNITTASVSDLTCGQNYSIRVKPHSQHCSGCSDAGTYVETWPCPPSGVSTVQDCVSGNVTAAWQGGKGSDYYTATMQSGTGVSQTCTSASNTCSISHLSCGNNFSVSVTATNQQCNTTSSQTASLTSVPCVPMNVSVTMDCSSNTAVVSWSPSRGALQYLVTAQSSYDSVTCQTSGLNCTLYNHTCGSGYTAQVVAVGDNCSSVPSEAVTFNSSFCPPDQLNITLDCNNQSALLSWTPSVNAVEYYARAQTGNGNKLCCYSKTPSCIIQGLECGTVYNFTVKTSDGTCNSSFSNPVQMGAVPCPPGSVTVQLLPMQNKTQVLHFTWNQTSCMDSEYLVLLKGSLLGDSQALVDVSSYWNNRTYFEIPLPCGTSYTATVESRNTAGTSDPSMFLTNTTAPCPPPGVVYTSNSSLATVSWNASVFATEYTVYDNSVTPRAQLCRTAGPSCSLPCTTCTSLVITASNSAGESEAENVVTMRRRRRDLSY